MNTKQNFIIQTAVIILILNGILLGVMYALTGAAIQANGQMLIFWGVGVVLTLLLGGAVAFVVGRAIDAAAADAQRTALPPTPVTPPVEPVRPAAKVEPAPQKPTLPPTPQPMPTASALQMLSILQREGRLIDFLQEDLSLYEDDQIGAAVRSIHAGCKGALESHVTLEPVVSDDEGSTITVPAGFDAHAIRLTGNVSGEPPFKGVVRHRGWRAVKVDLPQLMANQGAQTVVAAAEVEVER